MTAHILLASKNETSELCTAATESNTLIDEIPSLDALSFEHEQCPSQNCLCHNRKHVQNNSNSSGITAFGTRTIDAPPNIQKQAYSSHYVSAVQDPLSNSPLVKPTFQPLTTNPVVAQPNTDAACATDTRGWVFGSGNSHHSADSMQLFAQVCHTTDTGVSESPSLTFRHSHRGSHLPENPSSSAQDINLSELQSVLLATAEEPLPVSSCPVHADSFERMPACTCGQQASRLDDCTFDELAAYFDNFCYIPKNMSPMAEMMYM